MKTRSYCTCSNGPKTPAQILSFSTENAARTEAHKLLALKCHVTLERFHEFKEDGEGDEAWRLDLTDPSSFENLPLDGEMVLQ